ncbi:ABC transporter permease [Rummeliibacillus suwonensis]|uniref:lmo0954 family membrane protein n=1 Tax=Rummeliibacillus suwonensis TaxID=1306154 RepID=UPI0011B570EB|nr:ABC transporter permease [Rummeliibacillus suwonensis]
MKKFGLFIIGITAAITILCSLGALAGLAISAAILYVGIHFYLKSTSTFSKIVWALVAIAGLLTATANIPGFIGLTAIVILWYILRKWDGSNNQQSFVAPKSDDPFTNFENQWKELTK